METAATSFKYSWCLIITDFTFPFLLPFQLARKQLVFPIKCKSLMQPLLWSCLHDPTIHPSIHPYCDLGHSISVVFLPCGVYKLRPSPLRTAQANPISLCNPHGLQWGFMQTQSPSTWFSGQDQAFSRRMKKEYNITGRHKEQCQLRVWLKSMGGFLLTLGFGSGLQNAFLFKRIIVFSFVIPIVGDNVFSGEG